MFSATVMWGKSAPRWKTRFVGRRCGGTCVTSAPATRTVPAVACSKPAMIRRSVVLPQPLGPRRETKELSAIARSMPWRTAWSPKRFSMPVISTAGLVMRVSG